MRKWFGTTAGLCVAFLGWGAVSARAETMTADRAVKIALERSTPAILAEASVHDARANLYQSYSGVTPHVSASLSRGGTQITNQTGLSFQLDPVTGLPVLTTVSVDEEAYRTVPGFSGSWAVLDLSGISSVRAGQSLVQSAKLNRTASRQQLALDVRRQFYEAVRQIQLSRVSSEALKLSRDNERRVRALFEVGSVSRSDLLKAQVRTSQSVVDSLINIQRAVATRIQLAAMIGIPDAEIGEIDTLLTANVQTYDEAAILAEAEQARPDLKAALLAWNASKSNVTAARLARVPYVTLSGSANFNTRSTSKLQGPSETDRILAGTVALNMNLMNYSMEGASAAAKAAEMRAHDAYEALHRNLAGEVLQVLQTYREATNAQDAALSAIESANEDVKLTQQKYNVGSSTILDLIDAQVQLTRAKSDQVSALAAMRVAEAAVERVRGRGE